jgi:Niemann-Pick C1 protein
VIAASLFAVFACAAGLHRLEVKTETDELWLPQDTTIMRHRDAASAAFGPAEAWASAILTATGAAGEDGDSVLTPAAVASLFDLDARVRAIPGFEEACVRAPSSSDALAIAAPDSGSAWTGPCIVQGVVALWCDRAAFEAEVMAAADPTAALLGVVEARGGEACGGWPLERLRSFGEPTFASDRLVAAKHAMVTYVFDGANPSEATELSLKFEAEVKAYRAASAAERAGAFTVAYGYVAAFDSEIARSVVGDIPLVAAAFTLIMLATPATQLFRRDPSISSAALAAWGTLAVGLSVAMAYGLMSWLGVPFTSLAQVGPFIFLGVGVDDIVVLLEAFRAARLTAPRGGTVRERAAHAAEHAGVSVAITSATNALAFALGSLTVIPAVRWFCWYAAAAIFCDFALQLSFFLAIMLIQETADQRRGEPERAFFELGVGRRAVETKNNTLEDEASTKASKLPDSPADASATDSPFSRGVRAYSGVLVRPETRAAIFVLLLGYLAFSVALGGTIEEGLPRAALAPDDSFLRAFFAVVDRVFDTQTGVVLQHHFHGLDHGAPDAQARMLAAWGMYAGGNRYAVPPAAYAEEESSGVAAENSARSARSAGTNWLVATLEAAEALGLAAPCSSLGVDPDVCVLAGEAPAFARSSGGASIETDPMLAIDGDAFEAAFAAATAANPAMKSLVRTDETGGDGSATKITRSILTTRAVPVADEYPLQLKILNECHRVDAEVNALLFDASSGARAFTHDEALVYWSQDAVLWWEVLTNLSMAGAGVFIVCVFALAHPAAALAVAGVGCVDAFLFGTLVIDQTPFNVISVIPLVMAVGLAVDYTLHFLHAFLALPHGAGGNDSRDRAARTRRALQTMGGSVMKGGGTTLVGTLPMAFSRSTIFRTFFAMLFSTIVYGLAVGLALIPAIVASVPMPDAPHLRVESGDEEARKGDEEATPKTSKN